jgi:oligopeptide/dipeptide ABC transporter ATP-binding protein
LEGTVRAVDGVNLEVGKGETLGLAGESGCGKSTVGLSIIKLIPYPGRIVGGEIIFESEDIIKKSEREMREIRGSKISMIFQNPSSALNPVFTIKDQIGEALKIHQKVRKGEVDEKVAEILDNVGIPDPFKRMKDYPHQFSGGMKQRVMIAMAIACNPKLLIADEPTTNLDVTIQAQILELIKQLREKIRCSIILITHDLGIIAELCEKVAVMYAGKIVEYSDVRTLFREPKHPYACALLSSAPSLDVELERFKVIKGSVPNLINPPLGCRFWPRCDFATENCKKNEPPPIEVKKGHVSFCHHVDEIKC